MFNTLKTDEHLKTLLQRLAVVVAAIALALAIGAVVQLVVHDKWGGILGGDLGGNSLIEGGDKMNAAERLTQEERLDLLNKLSQSTTTVTTQETGDVVITQNQQDMSLSEREAILNQLSEQSSYQGTPVQEEYPQAETSGTSTASQMSRQEKMDILNQL